MKNKVLSIIVAIALTISVLAITTSLNQESRFLEPCQIIVFQQVVPKLKSMILLKESKILHM